MDLVRLPVGQQAEIDVDCIRIEELADRRFRLTGTALCNDAGEPDSVSLVGSLHFSTADEAEAAGIAWADTAGVDRLFISLGTREKPLEQIEIDGPL